MSMFSWELCNFASVNHITVSKQNRMTICPPISRNGVQVYHALLKHADNKAFLSQHTRIEEVLSILYLRGSHLHCQMTPKMIVKR